MGFLAVSAIRTLAAVISLNGEAVLLLTFAIQRLLGPNQTFSSGPVQHHCLKLCRTRTTRSIVNPKSTDLPLKEREEVITSLKLQKE